MSKQEILSELLNSDFKKLEAFVRLIIGVLLSK